MADVGVWNFYNRGVYFAIQLPWCQNMNSILGFKFAQCVSFNNIQDGNWTEFARESIATYLYKYRELKAATHGFNMKNKLGEGGFGDVFLVRSLTLIENRRILLTRLQWSWLLRELLHVPLSLESSHHGTYQNGCFDRSLEQGKCKDGSQVAVKRLSAHSTQGKDQFLAEVMTISRVQHRNLVKLRGCCVDGRNRLLVYEYLEKKSLRQTLFGNISFHQLLSLIFVVDLIFSKLALTTNFLVWHTLTFLYCGS